MIGNYVGAPYKYTFSIDHLAKYAPTLYALGCANLAHAKNDLVEEVIEQSKKECTKILVVGGDLSIEAE